MSEIDVSCLSVALLGYDDYSQTFGGITTFPVGRHPCKGGTVEQHDDVCILFNSSALAEMSQFGTAGRAVFRFAV